MMDKTIVNNEITSMRNEVQRAKVHVINKLVRESRKLKAKKGTEKQRERNCKKADRLAKLVLHIKKVKKDAVSKFALSDTRNPSEIFSDVSLPLEVKALARLAAHKNVVNRVNKFRAQFPNWETELPVLIAKMGSKKSRKKKSAQEQPQLINNKQIYSNSEDNVTANEPGRYVRALYLLDETPFKSEEKRVQSSNSGTEGSEGEIGGEISDSELRETIFPSTNSSKSKLKKIKQENVKRKFNGIAEVKRFTDFVNRCDKFEHFSNQLKINEYIEDQVKLEDTHEDPMSQINKKKQAQAEPVNNSTLDPFFTTDDGTEGYLSVVSKDENEKKNYRTPEEASLCRKIKPQKNHSHFKSFQGRDHSAHQPMNRKERRFQEFHKNKSRISPFGKETAAKEREVLHPSWEAKKKLKEVQILPFQGKKIKFDDD
ncbi:serum response factor-binding protein 1 isoform X2 [Anabrus simplex]|uniref:serum response factor-binding protein 1 isoform X2 n=1 Tax=Anabrus simplex TaxID=316456 RepID=UPI0035A39515